MGWYFGFGLVTVLGVGSVYAGMVLVIGAML